MRVLSVFKCKSDGRLQPGVDKQAVFLNAV